MLFDPTVDFLGSIYTNPIIAASGTFGCGEIYEDLIDYSKIGGFVTKAVTLEPRIGNSGQRIVETSGGLLNSIGLQNEGLDVFLKEKLPKFHAYPCKVLVNVAGSTTNDYIRVVEAMADEPTISGFEINVSCPNVEHGGMSIGISGELVRTLTSQLKKLTKLPIIIKLSPNVTDITEIAKSAQEGGADALTVVNTFLGMAIDTAKRKPVLGNITGGYSGPSIKPLALRCVWQVRKAVNIPIIGCGGISTGLDAIEFIMAGAAMIQIGTAIFREPHTLERVAKEMTSWALEHGYRNYKEIVGVAHENS